MNPEPTPTPEETAQANETISQTPVTLPLKSPSPVFVEAELPVVPAADLAVESQSVESPLSAPENSVAGVDGSATVAISTLPAGPVPSDGTASEPMAEAVAPSTPEAAAILPTIEFSPPPGAPAQSSLLLELRTSTPAEIRYALDADDVNAQGTLYEPAKKIFLYQSTSVATRAFVDGQEGPLATARFEVVQPAWQKIEPIDQSDATPHEIGEQCALEGPWKLTAASTRGKLHAHRGLWREDSLSYGIANAADGTYAITIVSDGAGSANLSRVGSKLLCAVALEHLQTGLTGFAPLATDDKTLVARDLPPLRALLVEAASLALHKLREEAARRGRPLGDFSSTLLILVRREWNGAQLCAALQSGDGSIALLDDDGDLTLLGEADHGEHTSETKFLTTSGMEAELPSRVKFSIRPRLRAAMVISDGVADDFFPEIVRYPELFAQVMPLVEADFAVSGAALLDWMRYEKKGSSDDRAMILSFRDVAVKIPDVAPTAIVAETPSVQAPESETASSETTGSEVASSETTGSETPKSDIAPPGAPISEEKPDGE